MQLAVAALIVHAAFSIFSAFAFATFLKPPLPDWLQTPVNQRAMAIGFTYGGQTTVLLGAIAGLAFLMHSVGRQRALVTFALAFGLSLASELAGTRFGIPFGAYQYTDQLGYKIAGLVPFNIPTSWFYMLVASLAITSRIVSARDTSADKWKWAMLSALILTAWDVSMDPAMVRTNHWLWSGTAGTDQSLVSGLITRPVFYGMPISNWLGWLLTGVVVSRAMLAVINPTEWKQFTSGSLFPPVLYAVNGILPITICLTHEMIPAGIAGIIAMAIPLVLARTLTVSRKNESRLASESALMDH